MGGIQRDSRWGKFGVESQSCNETWKFIPSEENTLAKQGAAISHKAINLGVLLMISIMAQYFQPPVPAYQNIHSNVINQWLLLFQAKIGMFDLESRVWWNSFTMSTNSRIGRGWNWAPRRLSDCLPRVAKACVLCTSQFYHFTASRMCSLCPIHSCFKDQPCKHYRSKPDLLVISPFIIGLLTTTYFFLVSIPFYHPPRLRRLFGSFFYQSQ